MKKEEAKRVSIAKSKTIIETLELILTDSMQVEGKLEFDSVKHGTEKKEVCTLEIYVPKREYERHWLMDIPTVHSAVFYKQVLSDLLENFGNLEKI